MKGKVTDIIRHKLSLQDGFLATLARVEVKKYHEIYSTDKVCTRKSKVSYL